MMVTKPLVVVVCAALTAFGCNGDRKPPGTLSATAVVRFNESVDQQTLERFREEANADLLATLPRSNAQIWRINPNDAETLTTLKEYATRGFVEVSQSAAAAALSPATEQLQLLSTGDRFLVERLTAGLSSEGYRVTAARPLSVDADILDVSSQDRISVPLLSAQSPVFSRERVDRDLSGEFTWIGNLIEGNGDAILVVGPQGITGRVRLGNDVYSVFPLSEGRQLIRRDQSQFPPDHPPMPPAAPKPPGPEMDAASCDPVDETVDVLVAYSSEVASELKDPAGLAKLAVAQTNRSFQKSKVTATVQLVGTVASGYQESGSISSDLAALRKGSIKKVADARKATAADIVVLLVSNRDYCGEAAEILAKSTTAYAVVSQTCAVGNVSFAHEMGHLFGARHDREADNTDTPGFKYAHGYALKNEWRTVMAYPGTCSCTRKEMWGDSSIPHPDSKGVPRPTGIKDEAEDARVIRARASALAQFQCQGSITR